jgi:SAM-dependent methyltransferase
MSASSAVSERPAAATPSMLDLVRLSARPLFPPGGRDLYHQVALLTDMRDGQEILVAGCGPGTTVDYFVQEFDVHGAGVDEDPVLIGRAEGRAREAGLRERVQFQHASMEDLPYRDGVFDVVIGELGLTTNADPEAAIRELLRVLKPGGSIVLIQLVWKAPVDPARREILSRHLGVKPLMLVQLKRILKGTGVERLHTEAWSDEATAFRPAVKKPFPDFAELFSVPEKLGILRRAWRRWGWRGVAAALAREREVHRLLTRERILGLDLVKARKPGEPAEEETPAARGPEEPSADERASLQPVPRDVQIKDLPLFDRDDGM